MGNYLRIWTDDEHYQQLNLRRWQNHEGNRYFHIDLKEISGMTNGEDQTVSRRRRNRRLVNRIADPENGFPIIRQLIQKFAPILIEFLMKQLPIWLADVESLEDDQKVA